MAAAKSCASRKRTGKICFNGFLCGQFSLYHQGFNVKSLERFRRAQPHPATQDRLTILEGFSHARMIMSVGVAMRAGAVALTMLRRTRIICSNLFPRYPSVFDFKYYERRTSPKMCCNGYPVVRWYCNFSHDLLLSVGVSFFYLAWPRRWQQRLRACPPPP